MDPGWRWWPRPSVAAEASFLAVACHGGDDACGGIDAADALAPVVRDEKVAMGIQGQATGVAKAGLRCRPSVAADEARLAVSGHGGDDPRQRINPAHASCIGDEEVPLPVHGDAHRETQGRFSGETTVVAGARVPCPRYHRQSAAEIELKDFVQVKRGEIDIAGGIDGNAGWVSNIRKSRRWAGGPAAGDRGNDALLGECLPRGTEQN